MRRALECEVVVTSDRLVPCETPAASAPARAGGTDPARGPPLREPDLFGLGFSPRPRHFQVRPGDQPAFAHAR